MQWKSSKLYYRTCSLSFLENNVMPLIVSLLFLIFNLASNPTKAEENACSAPQNYTSISQRNTNSLLFYIYDCSQDGKINNVNYLFGTMHSDNLNLVKNNQNAFKALKKSKKAAFEMIINDGLRRNANFRMNFPQQSNHKLSGLLGDKMFSLLHYYAQETIPNMSKDKLEKMRPWAASILLDTPKPTNDGIVLDERMQHYAAQQKISLISLETADEQFSVFESLSEKQQLNLLKESIINHRNSQKQTKKLEELYKNKDLKGMEKLADQSFAKVKDPVIREHIRHNLIGKRNNNMANRINNSLKQGGVFIAVGALHLTGDNGLLVLFEKQGFYVDAVK